MNRAQRAGVNAITAGTLDATNLITINGVAITGFSVLQDDQDGILLRTINGVREQTGVEALLNSAGRIELVAEDGRNIEVIVSTAAAATITGLSAGAGTDVRTGTITLNSELQFQIGGTQELFAGFLIDERVSVNSFQAVSTLGVNSRDDANLALLIVDRSLEQVSRIRSDLGAVVNRLETTISNLSKVSENAAAARSRIMDADFAVETAALTRNQILQQASTQVLAQANSAPQLVLTLLQ